MTVPRPPLAALRLGVLLVQAAALALAPHGGQHVARRNAWSGMVAGAQRSRAHREAAEALEVTQHRTTATRRLGG